MDLQANQFAKMTLAAILGSAVTLGTYQLLDLGEKNVKVEYAQNTPSQTALYTKDADGNLVPIDFTGTAEKVTPAVVFIKSTVVQATSQRRQNPHQNIDPFREFFQDGNPFFEMPQGGRNTPQVGSGSGVIINESGYIVTNNHVVENASDVEVTLTDNRVFKAKVIGTDPSTDLAVIKIEASKLPYLQFANSDKAKVGEWVLAVGNPFGSLTSTVTAGIISAKGRSINILREKSSTPIESFIQTDAAINKGNSGGALVDLNGNLIGVNAAIMSPTGFYSGYGFAIPSNIVSKVVEDLMKEGVVQRGFLGIRIRSLDATITRDEGLDINSGVYVDGFNEGSSAEKSGILKGDVIVEIDDSKIANVAQLQEMVSRKRPGDAMTLKVNRKGAEKTFKVTLQNERGNTEKVKKVAEKAAVTSLGAKMEAIDASTAKALGIHGGIRVTELQEGKLSELGITEGYIITKVDKKPIKNVNELKAILENAEDGVMLEGIYEDTKQKMYYAFGL